MAGVATKDLAAYFEEAKRWDQDRLRSAERSKRLAWIVAAGSGALAIAAVSAVALLAPLKTVEPFVVRVNQTTGAVDVMTGLSGKADVTYDEAVTKFFLGQYVRSREGYLLPAAEEGFRFVSLLSTADEQQRWATHFRGSNPESPQVVYGPGGVAEVTIRNIGFINDEVATVRFARTVRTPTQTATVGAIATINFRYTKAPMNESDRLLNPLGFQVVTYRADPEVPE